MQENGITTKWGQKNTRNVREKRGAARNLSLSSKVNAYFLRR